MAKPIKLNAIRLKQKTKKGGDLFLVSMPVVDLLDTTAIKINWWEKEKIGKKNQGYQRKPARTRVRKIANYLANYSQPIFPTNIVLASRKPAKFEGSGEVGVLSISSDNYPLWVVDGQTRIEGFRYTIKEENYDKASGYQMPVVIITNISLLDELEQFYVLNSTQKKVNTALAQRLKLELAREHGIEEYKKLKIGEEWEPKAMLVVDELNSQPDSNVWNGRIQLPNTQKSPINIIPQTSFVTSLKPLFKDGLLSKTKSVDACYKYLRDYWQAIKEHFPDAFDQPKDYVIQKTPGVFILHNLAVKIFENLYFRQAEINVQNIYKELSYAFKEDITSNWWMKDGSGAATAGSMKGFSRHAEWLKDKLPDMESKK